MDIVAEAIVYAADNGAKIAELGFTNSKPYNGLPAAVDYFIANGGLIIVTAGSIPLNQTEPISPDYLNSRADCISVATTNENDDGATFGEYGSTNYGTWVDLCAPGRNIYSTCHSHFTPDLEIFEYRSSSDCSSSMVASAAALIWGLNPYGFTALDVRDYLLAGTDNIDQYLSSQYIGKMGSGRLNMAKAICINNDESEWSEIYKTDATDIAIDICQTEDGGYAFISNGCTLDPPIASNHRIHMQKLNALGCVELSKEYFYDDTAVLLGRSFIATSDGGYLIVGDVQFSFPNSDVCVIKTNSSGDKIWMRSFGGPFEQRGFGAVETDEGDFIVTGVGADLNGDGDVLIMKIDGNIGDSLQAVRYAQPGVTTREDGRSILKDYLGGYVVLASSNNGSAFFLWLNNNLDTIRTVTYSETGKLLWTFYLELTSDSGYICAGYSEQINTPPTPDEYDNFMLKLDMDRNICWAKTFGQAGIVEKAKGIEETIDGGFIIVGEIDSDIQGQKDIVLYKSNACGLLHWDYVFTKSSDEYPYAVIQSSDSGFIVCGRQYVDENYGHSYIIKIPAQPAYICGDINGDGLINILDIVYLTNFKYKSGPAPVPLNKGDVNCDGSINILDIIHLINYTEKGGPAPCPCN